MMGRKVELRFDGEPKAVQSVRFSKEAGRSYQPAATVNWKLRLGFEAKQQLPEGWNLMDGPIVISAKFVFLPPKGWTKRKQAELDAGATIYKISKPDLQDNLFKGVSDALTGVVWTDDSRIVRVKDSMKLYGRQPGITLVIEELDE